MGKKLLGVLLGLFLMVGIAAAQGFYVGGGSSQYQYMMNDGMIVGETMWQNQVQAQMTTFGIEDVTIAQVNSYMEGVMAQEIGNCSSMAYTETANYTAYGLSIDTSGVSAGASAGSYAFSATVGDAYGVSNAYTDVSITILP